MEQEQRTPDEKIKGEVVMRSPFLKKLENFWYHYKWQTIFGVFFLIVLVIALVQCTGNNDEDAYLMYAGEYGLGIAEKTDMIAVMKDTVGKDTNGDGQVKLSFGTYFILQNKDLEKIDASNRRYMAEQSAKALDQFDQEVLSGEATVCFLSPALFERVAAEGGFLPVGEYAPAVSAEALVSYNGQALGIKLCDMNLSAYPGFKNLPEDTVFCVRRIGTMPQLFDKKGTEAQYAANLELAKGLIALPLPPQED